MQEDLKRKRILFIAPPFFDYWKTIKAHLEADGFRVDTIMSFESSSLANRLVARYGNEKTKYKSEDRYYNSFIEKGPGYYDYLFVIKGDTLNTGFLKKFKINNPNAKLILYEWDSIALFPEILNITEYFDIIFSFEKEDSQKYGWVYRPLFFNEQKCNKDIKKDIDISFICTLKYERVQIYKQLKKIEKQYHLNIYYYIYVDKLTYIKRKYIQHDQRYLGVENKDIYFQPLSQDDTNNIYDRSKILADYTTQDQNGLSIRSIESIGHNCKLITNNQEVLKTDFYNPVNICTYKGTSLKISNDFFTTQYQTPNINVYDYYSLHGWINSIFN